VYKSRATSEKNVAFDFIFFNNFGGMSALAALPNVRVKIVDKADILTMLPGELSRSKYDEVRITTLAELVKITAHRTRKLIYEFHSSDIGVILNELDNLDLSILDEVWVPSKFSYDLISPFINLTTLKIVPNLVDTSIFTPLGKSFLLCDIPSESRPIVWVGRFDKSKNFKDFIELVSKLPCIFFGIMVVSLEDSVTRLAEVMYQVRQKKVEQRLKIFFNLTQHDMATLYRATVNSRGYFCSTSLAESFGYGVLEAALTGLPVIAYRLDALEEHMQYAFSIQLIEPGAVATMTNCIINSDWEKEYEENQNGIADYRQRFRQDYFF